MKQGFIVTIILLEFLVSLKGCIQGAVWIEPDKRESVLHVEGQAIIKPVKYLKNIELSSNHKWYMKNKINSTIFGKIKKFPLKINRNNNEL